MQDAMDDRENKRAKQTFTASDAFFEALGEAGVKYCFVNMGSDHPSLLEAMARGGRGRMENKSSKFPTMITCPNEMVAMSMADGYARYTGEPQCVIVHVDVGTQGLGAAVHNAGTGRAPVLVFAGLSPATIEGEETGSRTEFIHWIQDVPNQKSIVEPYCRHVAEIKRAVNVRQVVWRALAFAASDPAGPVYVCGTREVLEEHVSVLTDQERDRVRKTALWKPAMLGTIPNGIAVEIASAIAGAQSPLIVTGYIGRKKGGMEVVNELLDLVGNLRVVDSGGSDSCGSTDKAGYVGLRFGEHVSIEEADVIVVLDCDVPWIPARCRPRRPDCQIFHLDCDVMKPMMNTFYIDAKVKMQVDSVSSARAIVNALRVKFLKQAEREVLLTIGDASARKSEQIARISAAVAASTLSTSPGSPPMTSSHLASRLRDLCPSNTIWVIEAVTQTVAVADQLRLTAPRSWFNCGGGGLGWSGGAALGFKLASPTRFVCQIVGDGTFLFSVPSSVAWISARYKLPVLTIVLVNGGWHAPKRSLLLVHPDGDAASALAEDAHHLPLPIDRPQPQFGKIATAASGGEIWSIPDGSAAADSASLEKYLQEAIKEVQNGRSAVLDVCV